MLPAGVRHPASFGPPQGSNTESLATAALSNCVVHAFNYMLDLVLSMKGSPLHGKRSPSGPATAGMQNVQSARLYRERQGLMVSAIVQYSTSGKRLEPSHIVQEHFGLLFTKMYVPACISTFQDEFAQWRHIFTNPALLNVLWRLSVLCLLSSQVPAH